jgi:hypothetical protein
MMLSEILLDAVSFLDYSTLVMLRLANQQLLRFCDRYVGQLAFRRSFILSYNRSFRVANLHELSVYDITGDRWRARVHRIELDRTDEERIVDALTELQPYIGPHEVHELDLFDFNLPVKLLVDLIPTARYASVIRLNYAEGFSPSSQEYTEITSLFERPTWVEFSAIPIDVLAVFLQSAPASRLAGWSASAPSTEENIELDAALEDIIFRSCFDFVSLEQGEPKQVWFTGWNLHWDFLRRLIEVWNRNGSWRCPKVEAIRQLEGEVTIEENSNFIPSSYLKLGD